MSANFFSSPPQAAGPGLEPAIFHLHKAFNSTSDYNKPKKQSTMCIQNHGTFLPVFAAFIGRNLEVLLKLSDRELAANLGSSVPHCRCGQQKNTKEANSQKFHKSLVVEICPVGTPSTTLALLYCTS